MKFGAEPKKLASLAGLACVAGYLFYSNSQSDPYGIPPEARAKKQQPQTPQSPAAVGKRGPGALDMVAAEAAVGGPPPPRAQQAGRRRGVQQTQEWVPRVGSRRPEDRVDPATVDPTLRLDLLARLQKVNLSGGERSLFDYSTAPVPKVADSIIKPGQQKKGGSSAAGSGKPGEEGGPGEQPPSAAPKDPPPPPIPLRFFGFVNGRDGKRAFFLNGEEILMASEGQTLQSRYRIVRIGLSSAVVEDTRHKHEQTIPLEEIPTGGA